MFLLYHLQTVWAWCLFRLFQTKLLI